MGEHKLIMGKDIYFWNFIILMLFTLFEVGAVFFEEWPGRTHRFHSQRFGQSSSLLESSRDSALVRSSCTFGTILESTFELHSSQHSSFYSCFGELVFPTLKVLQDFPDGAHQTGIH